ncbi:MAG: GtrA family protein [Roseburia sp.]|nr:GtrA family protein [Roseburia sp.]
MKKLMEQLIKFGFVGVLCFLIDFVIGYALVALLEDAISKSLAAAIGGFFGFTVSVIVNYILSMKFVFKRKDDMDRKKEFVIFIVLSVIGLGINEIILLACTKVYETNLFLEEALRFTTWYTIAKVIATAVVMVYNFITRKIFLETKG